MVGYGRYGIFWTHSYTLGRKFLPYMVGITMSVSYQSLPFLVGYVSPANIWKNAHWLLTLGEAHWYAHTGGSHARSHTPKKVVRQFRQYGQFPCLCSSCQTVLIVQ